MQASITTTGCYLPEWVLSNRDVIDHCQLDVDDAWILSRTGIQRRHWMPEGQTTSDMVVAAAREILDRRGITARQLDRIVLATISGDYPSPATATIVAGKLGARCPAFDISASCAGFLYGLDLGAGAVQRGEKLVLVMAADARSRFINKRDRRGAVLFSDGAAGALLEPTSADAGLLGIYLNAEGGLGQMGTWIPAGGAAKPTTAATVANGEHFLHVDGLKDIFPIFIDMVKESIDGALTKARLSLRDIDWFIPHQGNAHLINAIIEAIDFPSAKTVNDVAEHGNTSGATIPIALAESIARGRIKPGDRVLMTSAGAGYTFGAVVHQF